MSRQRLGHVSWFACLLCLMTAASWAHGDEPQANPPKNNELKNGDTKSGETKDKPAAAPTALQVAQWIKDLDSDEFQAREQASKRLVAAGKHAAAQVGKAAEGDSPEVTARCLDVLAKLWRSPDAETKAEAKKALETLTKSKNPTAARQAESLIDPARAAGGGTPPMPLVPGAPPIPGVPVPGVPFPGVPRIEIGGIGIAGPGMRISVKSTDGNKTIEVIEGGKKTKIEESAKGEIKMETTETVDGKEKSAKYEAKDAEELKKKYPDAHKIYEKYSKFAPGIGIAIGIGGIPPGGIGPGGVLPAVPLPAPIPGFAPGGGFGPAMPIRFGPVPQKALDQIEEAKKQLADATDKLRKLAEESKITPEAVKKLADQIDAAKKQLEEARAQLPK